MDKKPKPFTPQPKQEARKTVPCPVHGMELTVEIIGGKQVAICRCKVKDNIHFGKPVWESPETRRTV